MSTVNTHPFAMQSLRAAVLALLFSIPAFANFKEVTVQPGVTTETVLAFYVIGCTPGPGMTAQITVQPKHGTATISSGSYTTPGCPGVQFPGVQANYTWTDATGQPGSGSDAFHVTFTAPPGHAGVVDYDILISTGFPGKLLGPEPDGLNNPEPNNAPACHCNAGTGGGDTGPDNMGLASAGDPIDLASGNMAYAVTDYRTSGTNPLAFIRYYNSGASISSFSRMLGLNWRSNFDRYVNILTASVVAVERPGGKVLGFAASGAAWLAETDVDGALTHSGNIWTLTTPDDTVETYSQMVLGTLLNNEAMLTSIRKRNGYTQNLFYNAAGQLTSVTDSYNRTLTFNYTNGLLTSLTTPDGTSFVYAYNANKTLSFMASPVDVHGGATYNYFYENTALPGALTGVGDRYGERLNTWTYDGIGRVLTSSQGGPGVNANLTTIAYNDTTGSRTVTNALGVTDIYTFTTLAFIPKVAQISRAATAGTPAMTRSFTYDANGYLATATDWNGIQTTYTNNAHGLPTSITEAVGKPEARTETIVYNTTFIHLPASVVAPGVTATFTYDTAGNMLTRTLTDTTATTVPYATKGQARTWTYTYDVTGHLLTIKNPRTDVTAATTFAWDAAGALASITDALGHAVTVTSRTGGGFPLTIADPNGVTETLTYDGQMRVTTSSLATSAGALTTQYGYWFGNLLFSVKPPDGSEHDSSPDAALRPLNLVDAYGDAITYTLDALGNRTQTKITDSTHAVTLQHSATFDALGRQLTDVGGAGQTAALSHDNNGNVLTLTDPLGRKTTQVFDALNRLTKSTDANAGITQVAYDTLNRPLTVTDPNGNVTSYVYDGFGDVIQQTSPDSGVTVYHYDPDGNLTSRTDAAGVVTNYTYDKLDRTLTTTYPADATLNVAYNYDEAGHGFGIGRLTSLTDAAGALSRSYDERGKLISEKRTISSGTLTTSYTYDAAGRLASTTYPSGAVVTYTRDLAGNVVAMPFSAVNSDAQFVGWFAHLPFGPVNSINYNNGDLARFAYDADYRLTTLSYRTFQNVPYFQWTYSYDAANNVSSIVDNITAANGQTFGYDVLDRLTSATSSGTYGSLAWIYDKNGNLTSRTAGGITTGYSYTAATNRLAVATWPSNSQTFSYTPTGNISGVVQNGSTVFTGGYSKANRLASVTGVPLAISSMLYDAFGRRFSKANPGSTPTTFVYDQDGSLIEENNNGTITDYIYMDGINIGNWEPAEKHLYMIDFDRLGTPLVARDGFGLTNWAAFSQPYGSMTQTVNTGQFTGPVTQKLRLPGQYFDSETGLHYNGFRDYMPSIGRYLEADPIALIGGINPYRYANGTPLGMTDKYGLDPSDPRVEMHWLPPAPPELVYPDGRRYPVDLVDGGNCYGDSLGDGQKGEGIADPEPILRDQFNEVTGMPIQKGDRIKYLSDPNNEHSYTHMQTVALPPPPDTTAPDDTVIVHSKQGQHGPYYQGPATKDKYINSYWRVFRRKPCNCPK